MDFGRAIEELKAGNAVAREGWNGKGMFLYFVPPNQYASHTSIAKTMIGESVNYRGYITMKTAQGDVVPWVASQSDVLEEDWQIVK